MLLRDQAHRTAQELIAFIDASPWHAVASVEQRLLTQGYIRLEESERWQLAAGGRYYVIRGGASLIAFVVGSGPLAESGFRIVGATAIRTAGSQGEATNHARMSPHPASALLKPASRPWQSARPRISPIPVLARTVQATRVA